MPSFFPNYEPKKDSRVDEPVAGGILMIVGSVAGVVLIAWVFLPLITSNPGGVDPPVVVFLVIMAVFLAPLVALSIVGGIAAIRRSSYSWALVGGVCSVICSTVIGVIALILIVRSKNEFSQPKERTISAPRNWPKV